MSPTNCMKGHVPLKRKALDDFIDNSQRPTRRRRACASYLLQAPVAFVMRDISRPAKARRGTLSHSYPIADLNAILLDAWAPGCQSGAAIERNCECNAAHPHQRAKARTSEIAKEDFKKMSKRKALEEVPSGSSPPTPKRCFLPHSPVIANLIVPTPRTADSAVQSPYWPFPNELVLDILEKLLAQDLRPIVQVSCLSQELAAPLYFHSVGLQFDDKSLLISTQACLTLLLYRHTTLFHMPNPSKTPTAGVLGSQIRKHLTMHILCQFFLTSSLFQPPTDETDTPHIPLHSLRILTGPLWYLVSLLHKVHVPLHIQTLKLHLDEESLASTPNYLSSQFIYHIGTSIQINTPCPWLGVFDDVEEVCLRPGNIMSSEHLELEDAFYHPEHPYHLDIGSYF
ncbi:hypothetical protein EDB19DRAFT_1832376 [Suillus lakei]|nr:hypothetical protein EDB19DRAFT_1832376 [Suillus lakei]